MFRENKYKIILIMLLSLCLSFLAWRLEPIISRDGILYLKLSNVWYATGDFHSVVEYIESNSSRKFQIPPLTLWLIKLLMECGLPCEFAGVVLNIFIAAFLPLVAYSIAEQICNDHKVAICSALFMAVHPSIISLSIEPQREIIYLFLCGISIYFLIRTIKTPHWTYPVYSGICCGLSLLTRYETIELYFIALLVMVISIIKFKPVKKKYFFYFLSFCLSSMISFVFLLYIMGASKYLLQNSTFYYTNKFRSIISQSQRF